MIKVFNVGVYNMAQAIKGMRNPMDSWEKSDSHWDTMYGFEPLAKHHMEINLFEGCPFFIGEEDMKLAKKLIMAGSDHSKFMRQVFVSMDITAPIYWWKEMSTYKVATTANSTSSMHSLCKKPITADMFSIDDIEEKDLEFINSLEALRLKYVDTKRPLHWRRLIQRLPSSLNQTRTWTANYHVLRNIRISRPNHKLIEWREFCKTIDSLPYSELITEGIEPNGL
jgi:hypothetical protein